MREYAGIGWYVDTTKLQQLLYEAGIEFDDPFKEEEEESYSPIHPLTGESIYD